VSLQVMLPRFWGASTKRRKDAGSPDSGSIGATEDAAARSVIAFQKPGGHCLEGHRYFSTCCAPPSTASTRSAVLSGTWSSGTGASASMNVTPPSE
jgi:hypothetical protein